MRHWFACLATLITLPVLAGSLVQFRTVFGDLEFELLDQEKPITTANFLRYVHEGAYDGGFFHRQVPGFIIQGGGIKVVNLNQTDAEFELIPTHPPITNEFHFGPEIGNTLGTLAMAKGTSPDSATSQFFINLKDNRSDLNATNNSGGFTVFGRLVAGTNTLQLLNSFVYRRNPGEPLTNVVVRLGYFGTNFFPLTEVPLTLLYEKPNGDTEVRFQDFLFVDVTPLQVAVREIAAGRCEISWEGRPDGTNTVEFTTSFPPQWQTLTNLVQPTEARPVVVDEAAQPDRFYRVRINRPPTGL